MKATVEKIENRRATLSVEVEPEAVARALDHAYRHLVHRVQIPGFRKGRAPRFLVERHLGKAALYEEALDHLLPEAYSQAVAETGIEPIDRPELKIETFSEEQGLRFTAEVEVKPEVDLGDYRSVRVEVPPVHVTAEDVDRELERWRELQATLEPAGEDAVAEKGMVAVLDLAGTLDGEPIPNGQATDYMVELGSGRLLDGVEEQLVGMRPGEEKDVPVTFPDDHPDERLRGKTATFHIRLKELKRKQLPALDDDFARDVAGVASLQELRQQVEKELTRIAEERARAEVRQQVVQKVVEGARLEVPETLVRRQVEDRIRNLENRLRRQGDDLEGYLKATGQTREQLEASLRPQAVEDVRTDLVLDAVAKAEGIEASDAEVEAELRTLAAAMGQPYAKVRQQFVRSGLVLDVAETVRRRKTIDWLVARATGQAAGEAQGEAGDAAGAGEAAAGAAAPGASTEAAR
ncbi:trigger factor [Thermaerobacter marianensis DSM 12885]|uniref:Trigger factor n=1 Tax=Thermaerobacter marianensis (strain ATCC 700841 / DSM 12885 / JCM 10246 / 7p75a) TaxID=644966 RepID=E6SKT3_THEM7|nr:trigger factor [Thermaerobacter marianensis]ADU52306.1 trigger factor [Thermaerobacter marianensis DSM 12885]